ncbi:MAG: cytochrome b/b6 domain-containing protein [Gammaproteobacteria bacterium]|jgi:Ni/Fe-hydrogenase 1 B-type cytochrome subunit
MNGDEFKRVLIWSGWLRLSHWSIALATLGLLLTGWQLEQRTGAPAIASDRLQSHYYAASLLIAGLILRVVLMLLGKPQERLGGLLPRASEWRSAAHMLRFYLTLGSAPLPRWYAHNPLWKPVFLIVYVALGVQILTGSLMPERPVIGPVYLPSVHAFWAQGLLWFSVLHALAVAVHDLKGKTADVSAMINGYRVFFVDRSQLRGGDEQPLRFVSTRETEKPK